MLKKILGAILMIPFIALCAFCIYLICVYIPQIFITIGTVIVFVGLYYFAALGYELIKDKT